MFKVYWGDPKDLISKSVDDIPLEFLIMGCRGMSALKRYKMIECSGYQLIFQIMCLIFIGS